MALSPCRRRYEHLPFRRGMANSLLEAMSCGRPVLAADIPGNRSIVEEGVNGFLYLGEKDFLQKARRLAADPPLRLLMGERARAMVAGNNRPEVEARRYLEIYRR